MNETPITLVADALSKCPEVVFAYVHGSTLERADPRDMDVAVYLREDSHDGFERGEGVGMGFAVPLEFALEAILKTPVDVQVLNRAPLPFRARVASRGRVVVDNAPIEREIFEGKTRGEYFDFRPKRQAYLREHAL